MKHSKSMKIISVICASLLLIAASVIPALAYTVGDPVKTYVITIESGSEVFVPETTSVTVQDGDTYTFSIPEDVPTTLTDDELGEYEVEFSCWRFTGEYEAIGCEINEDGECTERTVTLKPKSDLKAVACFYEDNALFYMVDVDTNSEDYRPLIDQGECPKGENWTFSVPEDMEDFDCWEFDGEYEVVQGSVDENRVSFDRTVVLKPKSGIQAFARFNEPLEDEATDDEATTDQAGGSNDSKTSPKTGDAVPMIVCVALLALAACAFSIKKIRE